MGKPAARLTDMHVCPMSNGPVPHVGGPIIGPGSPTVLIGGMPAAVMGDLCTCTGPPDTIILGSTGVMIGGKPAARMGDTCAHGGTIVLGCMTVLIGETLPGVTVVPPSIAVDVSNMMSEAANSMSAEAGIKADQIATMKEAAENGAPLVHNPKTCPICSKKA